MTGMCAAVSLAFSLGLLYNAWKVRRKVKRGEAAEMKRGLRSGEAKDDVELQATEEGGLGGGDSKTGARVDVNEGVENIHASLKPKPSLNSVATGGEASKPAEFV